MFDASLKNALEEGILSDKDIRTISDVFKSVLVNITKKHETLREEILKRMSGTELDYPATTAYNKGKAEMFVESVQNSMKNLHCSLEEACKNLGHTVEEYNKALELLKAEKQ